MNPGVPVQEVPIALPAKQARPAQRPAWSTERVLELFGLRFNDLLFQAQQVHREHHPAHEVQLASLLSIKTGGCPEDCGYCSQSAHYDTGLPASKLMELGEVVQAAAAAKAKGATRFCMGAAWRETKDRDIDALQAMVREVKALGLETCMTLGMLQPAHARALKEAGLDFYNHNLDTSPQHYGRIIGTRTYDERLDTLRLVRNAGIQVCCGGIVGMGESRADRAALIAQLASLDPPPESVPINNLIPIPGTPLQDAEPIDPFEFVRTVAVARITMPKSVVRLSAGREHMDDALQALCFLAGASSIFCGDRLLTAGNPQLEHDLGLLQRLDLVAQAAWLPREEGQRGAERTTA